MKVGEILNLTSLKLRLCHFIVDPEWVKENNLHEEAIRHWKFLTLNPVSPELQIILGPCTKCQDLLLDDLQEKLKKYDKNREIIVFVPYLNASFTIESIETNLETQFFLKDTL